MISSNMSSFDRSTERTMQCIFLFLSSCLTQGASFLPWSNECSPHPRFFFFPSLSFASATSHFHKVLIPMCNWIVRLSAVIQLHQQQQQQLAGGSNDWPPCVCFQEWPSQDGKLLNLLPQCDFVSVLCYQAAVPVGVHGALASSPSE